MKFIKKLSDWKIWLFCILPITMLAVWFALMIYAYVKGINNSTFFVCCEPLFIVAVLLMIGYAIFSQLKRKHILRSIAGIVFVVCFLGLQIAQLAMIPTFFSLSQEEDELYQLYIDTPYEDIAFKQRQDAWIDVKREVSDLSFTIHFINLGSYAAFAFACFCCSPAKQKNDKSANPGEDSEA